MSNINLAIQLPFDASEVGVSSMRANAAISFIVSADGERIPLSRYKDEIWDLSPYVKSVNQGHGENRINWNTRGLSAQLVNASKDLVLSYWKYGISGAKAPEASTVLDFATRLLWLTSWLHEKGVKRFSQINQHVVNDYIAFIKNPENELSPSTRYWKLHLLEIIFHLRSYVDDSISFHPWPDRMASVIAGRLSQKSTNGGLTEIIPEEIAKEIFQKALNILDGAEKYLNVRDDLLKLRMIEERRDVGISRVTQILNERLDSLGIDKNSADVFNPNELSTACYIIIAMLTGMRNHEISSIKAGGYYESIIDGETIGWVKGESHKTFEGDSEWMAPPIVGRAIQIQERVSSSWRDELVQLEERTLKALEGNVSDKQRAVLLKDLQSIKLYRDRIFVVKRSKSMPRPATIPSWNERLKRFSQEFEWDLASHQFRRTFAVFVASHAMGDLRYLRHHFKHWSLDMTLLYARNEKQDQKLYEEMLEQVQDKKIGVVEHWLSADTALSGGNVSKIKDYRRREEVKTTADKRQLAAALSEQISIRGTGHSWCLSDHASGCGGKGLYEMTRCGGCGDGVIDDTQKIIWMNVHQQHKELLELDDIGPGGQQRVQRDIVKIERILSELECNFDSLIKESNEKK